MTAFLFSYQSLITMKFKDILELITQTAIETSEISHKEFKVINL